MTAPAHQQAAAAVTVTAITLSSDSIAADVHGLAMVTRCGCCVLRRLKVAWIDHEHTLAVVEEYGVAEHLGVIAFAGYAGHVAGQLRRPLNLGVIRLSDGDTVTEIEPTVSIVTLPPAPRPSWAYGA